MKKIFEGIGTALVTPFIDEKVDFVSFKNLIEKNIREGARAIVILATTGEGTVVEGIEREQVIRFAKNIIGDKAKLIVGTGSNNLRTAIKNTYMAKYLGADGVLVVTPYYNKTTQEGIIKYYEKLSELKIPIIMYNVPSRTGLNIELSTIKKLLNNPYIYGIKESTQDINRIMDLLELCDEKIAVYSGEDNLNLLFYSLGGTGAISVTSNQYTQYVAEIFNKEKSGEHLVARLLQNKIQALNKALFLETNPIPIKELLKSTGTIESSETRPPLVPMSEKNCKKLLKTNEKFIESTENID